MACLISSLQDSITEGLFKDGLSNMTVFGIIYLILFFSHIQIIENIIEFQP